MNLCFGWFPKNVIDIFNLKPDFTSSLRFGFFSESSTFSRTIEHFTEQRSARANGSSKQLIIRIIRSDKIFSDINGIWIQTDWKFPVDLRYYESRFKLFNWGYLQIFLKEMFLVEMSRDFQVKKQIKIELFFRMCLQTINILAKIKINFGLIQMNRRNFHYLKSAVFHLLLLLISHRKNTWKYSYFCVIENVYFVYMYG